MPVEGVARPGEVEAERETLAGRHLGHVPLGGLGLLERHAVLVSQPLGAVPRPLGRRLRVELEAAPPHGDLVAVLELGQRGLEAALADVAPGAGDV